MSNTKQSKHKTLKPKDNKTKKNTVNKLNQLNYEKNKGIVKFVDYNKKGEYGVSKTYNMLCKLDKSKLEYIKNNPHTAHFFCNYNNVIFCNTPKEQKNCDKQLGITYSRQFRPEPFTGNDPYVDYIINHDDLIHHINKTLNYNINIEWINLYEFLNKVVKNNLDKLNKKNIKYYSNGSYNSMKAIQHFCEKNFDISQSTTQFLGADLIFIDKKHNIKNINYYLTNEIQINSYVIIELEIPLNPNYYDLLYNLYDTYENIDFYLSSFQSNLATFYISFHKTKEFNINKFDKYDSSFISQIDNIYHKMVSKQINYTDKLIFYSHNLENIPWNHIYNLRQMMEVKKKDWLKQNPL